MLLYHIISQKYQRVPIRATLMLIVENKIHSLQPSQTCLLQIVDGSFNFIWENDPHCFKVCPRFIMKSTKSIVLFYITTLCFQWIDDSTYSYRHHTVTSHNHTSRLAFLLNDEELLFGRTDASVRLMDNARSNRNNFSCYAILNQFLASFEWVPVSTKIVVHYDKL